MKRIYIASPLGFAASTAAFMDETVAQLSAVVAVENPWDDLRFVDEFTEIATLDSYAERVDRLQTINTELGRTNAERIDKSDAVFAVLDVLGTYRYTTSSGYTLTNTNKVLSSSPSVLGGKTGYDWDSGWCLVQIAQRQNTRMVAVTLDGIAPDDWYNDNLVLLDYGFDQQSALGSRAFDGDVVTWVDPAPIIFAQSGSGEAVITGESESGEQIVTREETVLPERISAPQTITDVGGRRGSTMLAGVGATALAIGMGVSRWMDFGGDRSMASVGPSLSAMTGSLRRAIPAIARRPPNDASAEISHEEQAFNPDLDSIDKGAGDPNDEGGFLASEKSREPSLPHG